MKKLPISNVPSMRPWPACKAKADGSLDLRRCQLHGKTEVAMRAAFLAVGAQTGCVLAPTTILAQQHLQTFRHRFRNHGTH